MWHRKTLLALLSLSSGTFAQIGQIIQEQYCQSALTCRHHGLDPVCAQQFCQGDPVYEIPCWELVGFGAQAQYCCTSTDDAQSCLIQAGIGQPCQVCGNNGGSSGGSGSSSVVSFASSSAPPLTSNSAVSFTGSTSAESFASTSGSLPSSTTSSPSSTASSTSGPGSSSGGRSSNDALRLTNEGCLMLLGLATAGLLLMA